MMNTHMPTNAINTVQTDHSTVLSQRCAMRHSSLRSLLMLEASEPKPRAQDSRAAMRASREYVMVFVEWRSGAVVKWTRQDRDVDCGLIAANALPLRWR